MRSRFLERDGARAVESVETELSSEGRRCCDVQAAINRLGEGIIRRTSPLLLLYNAIFVLPPVLLLVGQTVVGRRLAEKPLAIISVRVERSTSADYFTVRI
jgi:hypothetical protein